MNKFTHYNSPYCLVYSVFDYRSFYVDLFDIQLVFKWNNKKQIQSKPAYFRNDKQCIYPLADFKILEFNKLFALFEFRGKMACFKWVPTKIHLPDVILHGPVYDPTGYWLDCLNDNYWQDFPVPKFKRTVKFGEMTASKLLGPAELGL